MKRCSATRPRQQKKARLDLGIVRDVARYQPLVKKLLGRASWENNPEATAVDEPLAAE
jgi:hypothetical protein